MDGFGSFPNFSQFTLHFFHVDIKEKKTTVIRYLVHDYKGIKVKICISYQIRNFLYPTYSIFM